jgi:hypothetical protein
MLPCSRNKSVKNPENDIGMFTRNTGKHLPGYTVLKLRRSEHAFSYPASTHLINLFHFNWF